MSTSSKTTTGALPPSSRWTRLSVFEATSATRLPDSTLPVIETMSTVGWATIRSPVSPAPVSTLSTPLGRTSAASSAKRSVVSGVVSEA